MDTEQWQVKNDAFQRHCYNLSKIASVNTHNASIVKLWWHIKINSYKQIFMLYNQCWGKLLLKVMHYNIVLHPKKKVTNYVT